MADYRVRGGLKLKRKLEKVHKMQKAVYVCPNCKHKTLKRKASGIWYCKKCGLEMAGGAYSPESL